MTVVTGIYVWFVKRKDKIVHLGYKPAVAEMNSTGRLKLAKLIAVSGGNVRVTHTSAGLGAPSEKVSASIDTAAIIDKL